MKIYFAGSIRGGRSDKELYLKIIDMLGSYGEVLTEHIGNQNLTGMGEKLSEEHVFNRDMSWLKKSDIIIAEVTQPSLGVGYELAFSETLGKKILCLYREGQDRSLSAMIAGNRKLTVKKYKDISELPAIFDEFLKHKK